MSAENTHKISPQMPEWVGAIDPCETGCPSREVIDLVGDRWSLLVMLVIAQGAQRNGELKRRIGGISQKMLTQTLRSLETSGLVHRHDFQTIPPHVEYSLTPLGVSLGHALTPLFHWIEEHFPEIDRARSSPKA